MFTSNIFPPELMVRMSSSLQVSSKNRLLHFENNFLYLMPAVWVAASPISTRLWVTHVNKRAPARCGRRSWIMDNRSSRAAVWKIGRIVCAFFTTNSAPLLSRPCSEGETGSKESGTEKGPLNVNKGFAAAKSGCTWLQVERKGSIHLWQPPHVCILNRFMLQNSRDPPYLFHFSMMPFPTSDVDIISGHSPTRSSLDLGSS